MFGKIAQYLMGWVGCAVIASLSHAQQPLSAKWISYAGAEFFSDTVYAVATDSHTNAYFGGQLGQSYIESNDGAMISYPFDLESDLGGFVAKADADGTLQWAACLSLGLEASVYGLAYSAGAIYAAGSFGKPAVDDPWLDPEDARIDALLVKLDDTTGDLKWACALSDGADYADTTSAYTAVATDAFGNIYATGYTTITNLASTSTYSGGKDAVVVKYDPTGTLLWTRYLGGVNDDTAAAIATAADGSVYVGGQTRSPGWATLDNGFVPGTANAYGFLAKLNSADGNVVSSILLGATSGADAVAAILADATTGIILGGQRGSDGFVMKLTGLGSGYTTNWVRSVGGSAIDTVTSLTWQNGLALAGGTTGNGSWLAPQGEAALNYHGGTDGFLLQLNATTGVPLWSTYVGGAQNDAINAVAARGETIFAGGATFSPGFAYDGFWDVWGKDETGILAPPSPPYAYGFLGKWSPGVPPPPIIVTDVQDVIVNEGTDATFTLLAQSAPTPHYNWLRDGVPVAVTGTLGELTLPSVTPADNDALICCIASNIFGSVTSRVARLTVIGNGALTVTLTPAAAITQGAQWSVDGGTSWESSGGTVTLPPGSHTVTFSAIAGWVTPAPLPVTIASVGGLTCEGVYTPIVANAARSVDGTNVTLTVTAPPSGLTGWTLAETLPSGVTPTAYTPGGTWDALTRTLTFTGATATALAYTVTVTTSGVYTVTGQITSAPNGVTNTVTGDTQFIHANLARVINGTLVTIHAKQPSQFQTISETVHSGLTIVPGSVSSGGIQAGNLILWIMPNSQTLSYEVAGDPGTYPLSGLGTLLFGGTELIYGDAVIVIPEPTPTPLPDIVAFTVQSGQGHITFVSAVGQAYMVQTNATLSASGWHDCLPVTGTGATTTVILPAPSPRLFYRVGIQ